MAELEGGFLDEVVTPQRTAMVLVSVRDSRGKGLGKELGPDWKPLIDAEWMGWTVEERKPGLAPCEFEPACVWQFQLAVF